MCVARLLLYYDNDYRYNSDETIFGIYTRTALDAAG